MNDPEFTELGTIFNPQSSLSEKFEAAKRLEDPTSLHEVLLESNIPEIRSYALSKVTNQDVIIQVVLNDTNSTLRKLALDKLESIYYEVFIEVIQHDPEPILREEAVIRLPNFYQEIYLEIAIAEPDSRVRSKAIQKLRMNELEEEDRLKLAIHAHDPAVREGATYSIDDPQLLTKIAVEGGDMRVITHAIENIKNQEYLKIIATDSEFASARYEAIKKINDEEFIALCFRNEKNLEVKKVCLSKITSQEILQELLSETDVNSSLKRF